MNYTLQICHANEMIHDRWRTVDRFSEFSIDSLEHPTFEVSDGLLCRVVRGSHTNYAGVFYGDHWIDVSSTSMFMTKLRSGSFSASMIGKNLFEAHMEVSDITHYIRTYGHITNKMIDIDFIFKVVQSVLMYVPPNEQRPQYAFYAMKRYLNNGLSNEDWRLAQSTGAEAQRYGSSINDPNRREHHAAMACAYLHNSVLDPILRTMMAHAVTKTLFNSIAYEREMSRLSAEYAEEYRKTVPFHDIVIALVQL